MQAVAPDVTSPSRDALALRQRAWRYGIGALDTADLVALVVANPGRDRRAPLLADRLLVTAGGFREVARGSPREHARVIGDTRALRLSAAFELGRRGLEFSRERDLVGNAEDVYRLVAPRLAGLVQEVFLVVGVDIRNGLIEIVEVARGSLAAVGVHPREVFRPLIRMAAAGAVLVHNHPSGDPTPSPEDLELTTRLREVGSLIGIPIVDHVVVGDGRFRSISEGSTL
jgi:DNA repair protein RadC